MLSEDRDGVDQPSRGGGEGVEEVTGGFRQAAGDSVLQDTQAEKHSFERSPRDRSRDGDDVMIHRAGIDRLDQGDDRTRNRLARGRPLREIG